MILQGCGRLSSGRKLAARAGISPTAAATITATAAATAWSGEQLHHLVNEIPSNVGMEGE
jgi:hypothetical protein